MINVSLYKKMHRAITSKLNAKPLKLSASGKEISKHLPLLPENDHIAFLVITNGVSLLALHYSGHPILPVISCFHCL